MAVGLLVAVGIALIIIDTMAGTFYMLLLGVATLVSAAVLSFTGSLLFTLIAFLIISLIFWLTSQKIGRKIVGGETHQSGVDSLVGKEVIVHTVSEESNTIGSCRVFGDEWRIQSETPLTKGEVVLVVKITGATLHVETEEKE